MALKICRVSLLRLLRESTKMEFENKKERKNWKSNVEKRPRVNDFPLTFALDQYED